MKKVTFDRALFIKAIKGTLKITLKVVCLLLEAGVKESDGRKSSNQLVTEGKYGTSAYNRARSRENSWL